MDRNVLREKYTVDTWSSAVFHSRIYSQTAWQESGRGKFRKTYNLYIGRMCKLEGYYSNTARFFDVEILVETGKEKRNYY